MQRMHACVGVNHDVARSILYSSVAQVGMCVDVVVYVY